MKKLSQLKCLDLHNNKFKKFPEVILTLRSLEVLYLGLNKLNEIPSSIYSLPNLFHLSLRNNKIYKLPSGISRSQIESIDLLEVEELELPEEMIFCYQLKNFCWHQSKYITRRCLNSPIITEMLYLPKLKQKSKNCIIDQLNRDNRDIAPDDRKLANFTHNVFQKF